VLLVLVRLLLLVVFGGAEGSTPGRGANVDRRPGALRFTAPSGAEELAEAGAARLA
jgi:hypothetical protein